MRFVRTTHHHRLAPVARGAAAGAAAALLLLGCGDEVTQASGAGVPTSAAPAEDGAEGGSQAAPAVVEAPDGTTIVAEGGDLPDGVYRVEFTPEHLTAHGLSPDDVAGNVGVWTTTLQDGTWVVDQTAPGITDHIEGVYQVDGDDLYWRFHDTLQVLHVTWSTGEDGELLFEQVTDTGDHDDFQFALPWARVS